MAKAMSTLYAACESATAVVEGGNVRRPSTAETQAMAVSLFIQLHRGAGLLVTEEK